MASTSSSDQKILGFLPVDALPGVILVLTALAAMLVVNSPLGVFHAEVLKTIFVVGPEGGGLSMKVSEWVKNALMAVFFFFVGLELKRELLEGQLSRFKVALLPVAGAIGGMLVPALIFVAVAGPSGYANGWAIPAATDIAFALGVLSLLGNRVPPALKAFLLAVAVVDDLGAILVVAFAYTEAVAWDQLGYAAGVLGVLLVMNRLKVASVWMYALVGLALWVFVQHSGVNPTIAGVLIAACVPMRDRQGHDVLLHAEHALRPWVLFGVMPVFAFANAGVSLAGGVEAAMHPVAMGTALGLSLGKPIGILSATLLAALLLKAEKPGTLGQMLGVTCIAGIGFTMSLFIGALAFDQAYLQEPVRIGVYVGSVVSAVAGLWVLSRTLPASTSKGPDETEHFMRATD